MRLAVFAQDGRFERAIEAEEGFLLPGRFLLASDLATDGWMVVEGVPVAPGLDIEARRREMAANVDTLRDVRLAEGFEVTGGLHVALSDTSRTDLGGMATTALAAMSGAVPWPADYALGWISIENTRIPLATPQDGLTLAAAAGARYAAVVQHARSLKDAILAADDASALAAIDILNSWPA